MGDELLLQTEPLCRKDFDVFWAIRLMSSAAVVFPFGLSSLSLIITPTTSSLALIPKRHASFFWGCKS